MVNFSIFPCISCTDTGCLNGLVRKQICQSNALAHSFLQLSTCTAMLTYMLYYIICAQTAAAATTSNKNEKVFTMNIIIIWMSMCSSNRKKENLRIFGQNSKLRARGKEQFSSKSSSQIILLHIEEAIICRINAQKG